MAQPRRLFPSLMHPVLLSLRLFGGHFELHGFGVFVALGCAAAIVFAMREAKRRGEDVEAIRDLCFWTLIAGLVGARALYVLASGRAMWDDCLDAAANEAALHALSTCARPLRIWEGGLVFYGGVGAGAACAFYYGRLVGLRFARTADILAPSLALGHAIGRVGCFLAGCCFGKTCAGPLGTRFPDASIAFQDLEARGLLPRSATETLPLHATQLYEAAGELLLFLLLVRLARLGAGDAGASANANRPRALPLPDGRLTLVYLAGYSVLRFGLEIFRGDVARTFLVSLHTPGWNRLLGLAPDDPSFLSVSQGIALGVIALAALLLRRAKE